MKVIYDRETDTLSIIFSAAPVAESDEESLASFLITTRRVTWSLLRYWMLRVELPYRTVSNIKYRLSRMNQLKAG